MLMNSAQVERLWKITAYGPSGSGKTWLGVTAPDPCILLGERQGFETVRDAAKHLGKPLPPTFLIETIDDLRKAVVTLATGAPLSSLIDALRVRERKVGKVKGERVEIEIIKEERYSVEEAEAMKAALPYERPKTIVFDSMTEFLQLIVDGVEQESPPKMSKDGLPERSKRAFGAIKERGERMIRLIRDLPYHVVMLARQDDREVGEGTQQTRIVQPLTPQRNFPEAMMAASNACGLVEKRQEREETKDGALGDFVLMHRVVFGAESWQRSKILRPLRDIETANVSSWFKRLEQGAKARDPKASKKTSESAAESAESAPAPEAKEHTNGGQTAGEEGV